MRTLRIIVAVAFAVLVAPTARAQRPGALLDNPRGQTRPARLRLGRLRRPRPKRVSTSKVCFAEARAGGEGGRASFALSAIR
jgi:hypothetical protein